MSATHLGRAPSPAQLRARATWVPILSTIAGSAVALLPLVSVVPLLPPVGLILLLAWRALRPELWHAWIGLPLGLADDLLVGHALGTSAALWTAALLFLDAADSRVPWRNRWEAWTLNAGLLVAILLLSALLNAAPLTPALLPQLLAALLLMPLAQRAAAWLDRWRLAR